MGDSLLQVERVCVNHDGARAGRIDGTAGSHPVSTRSIRQIQELSFRRHYIEKWSGEQPSMYSYSDANRSNSQRVDLAVILTAVVYLFRHAPA